MPACCANNSGTVFAALLRMSSALITVTPGGVAPAVSVKRVVVTTTGGPTGTAGSAARATGIDASAASIAAASGVTGVIFLINSPNGCARPPRAIKARRKHLGEFVNDKTMPQPLPSAWIRHTASPRHFHPSVGAGIRAHESNVPPSHEQSSQWLAGTSSRRQCKNRTTTAFTYRCGGSVGFEVVSICLHNTFLAPTSRLTGGLVRSPAPFTVSAQHSLTESALRGRANVSTHKHRCNQLPNHIHFSPLVVDSMDFLQL